jgi:hypothetical protein
MRRFTRLINGLSKKFESHAAMVAVYTAVYNFCSVHQTLRVTPAIEDGLTDQIWYIEEVVAHMDFLMSRPKRPATYKKRIQSNSPAASASADGFCGRSLTPSGTTGRARRLRTTQCRRCSARVIAT